MKEKNNSVINVRLPEDMKEQLKLKLGHNMSGIMKEHFQKLLDVKEFEVNNKCWGCRKHKMYSECSFACLINDDGSRQYFILCNDCMNSPAPDISDDIQLEIYNHIKELAKENKHPEHLEGLSELCHLNKNVKISCDDDNKITEIYTGCLYFTKQFNLKIEEFKNGKSTQTHTS